MISPVVLVWSEVVQIGSPLRQSNSVFVPVSLDLLSFRSSLLLFHQSVLYSHRNFVFQRELSRFLPDVTIRGIWESYHLNCVSYQCELSRFSRITVFDYVGFNLKNEMSMLFIGGLGAELI